MPDPILHYIYDPLCGWCYGAAPLVAAARSVLAVRAHGGGMLTGRNRRPVTPTFRAYVATHDRRIAQLSGQHFGDAYQLGLLHDPTVVLDSEPPTAAVLAADRLAGRGLDLLARLQLAHYVEGRRIADEAVLVALAAEIGLEAAAFADVLAQVQGPLTHEHMRASRSLLEQVGGRGFPTFVLERGGVRAPIDLDLHFGRPREWQAWLRDVVANGAAPAAD